MADLIGLNEILSDLLITLINISVQTTVFFVKTTLKGFIRFVFDTLRYFEMIIDHLIHLFKR